LKKLKNIGENEFYLIEKFILLEKSNFHYLKKIGWGTQQIQNHMKKSNNFSICNLENNLITGILIGETVKNNDFCDLEIHLIYVAKKRRNRKVGSNLLKFIELHKNDTKISNIYLEVSEDNLTAIKFYEKNDFVFLRFRHNYYKYKNNLYNARCYLKKI
tara:strand:- start:3102 stop:3578 length:477 start_codon:yes stop_codon:yes gene_type:complete